MHAVLSVRNILLLYYVFLCSLNIVSIIQLLCFIQIADVGLCFIKKHGKLYSLFYICSHHYKVCWKDLIQIRILLFFPLFVKNGVFTQILAANRIFSKHHIRAKNNFEVQIEQNRRRDQFDWKSFDCDLNYKYLHMY
jgi:hypothetical protein